MFSIFFFQAEDGIRDLVRSRGLGDVYKRQGVLGLDGEIRIDEPGRCLDTGTTTDLAMSVEFLRCLLYTSDAADERSSVDLGGRRIIKKKKQTTTGGVVALQTVPQTDTHV